MLHANSWWAAEIPPRFYRYSFQAPCAGRSEGLARGINTKTGPYNNCVMQTRHPVSPQVLSLLDIAVFGLRLDNMLPKLQTAVELQFEAAIWTHASRHALILQEQHYEASFARLSSDRLETDITARFRSELVSFSEPVTGHQG